MNSQPPTTQQVRIGIIVDRLNQPAWVTDIIKAINSLIYVDICLIIKQNCLAAEPIDSMVYKLYRKLDRKFFSSQVCTHETRSIQSLLSKSDVLEIDAAFVDGKYHYDEESIKIIDKYNIDIMLLFSPCTPRQKPKAKYGILAFRYGDQLHSDVRNHGFWEVMRSSDTIDMHLVSLADDPVSDQHILKTCLKTSMKSVLQTRSSSLGKSNVLITKAIKQVYDQGSLDFDGSENLKSHKANKPDKEIPGSIAVSTLLLKQVSKYTKKLIKNHWYIDHWSLFYHFGRDSSYWPRITPEYRLISPPADRFWADCFPVAISDKYFIFIEELIYKQGKGFISVMEMDQKGNYTTPVKILECDYHLSYPFIFQWKDRYYMIPETGQNNTVEVYECKSFPDRWEPLDILIKDIHTVDSTIREIEGTYWMFTNESLDGGVSFNDALSIFYADNPFGPWHPHRKNPVKMDVRSSRPAGNLFKYKDQFFRPAQDSSVIPGYAISINRLDQVSKNDFRETVFNKILPTWNKDVGAVHTLNHAKGLTIIDAMVQRRRVSRDKETQE